MGDTVMQNIGQHFAVIPEQSEQWKGVNEAYMIG